MKAWSVSLVAELIIQLLLIDDSLGLKHSIDENSVHTLTISLLTLMSTNLMKYERSILSFTKHTTPVLCLVHWEGFGQAWNICTTAVALDFTVERRRDGL